MKSESYSRKYSDTQQTYSICRLQCRNDDVLSQSSWTINLVFSVAWLRYRFSCCFDHISRDNVLACLVLTLFWNVSVSSLMSKSRRSQGFCFPCYLTNCSMSSSWSCWLDISSLTRWTSSSVLTVHFRPLPCGRYCLFQFLPQQFVSLTVSTACCNIRRWVFNTVYFLLSQHSIKTRSSVENIRWPVTATNFFLIGFCNFLF